MFLINLKWLINAKKSRVLKAYNIYCEKKYNMKLLICFYTIREIEN